MGRDLVVLIATAGRPGMLDRTLRSLAGCQKPISYRETIVVENGEPCGTEAVVDRYRVSLNLRYLHVSEANKSHALNAAMATLGDSFIFFTDDDVRLAPGVLCAYDTAFSSLGEGHFFGGPIGVNYEVEPPEWLKQFMPASARGWSLPGGQQNIGRERFLGFNWAASTGDLRKAGPFNTNLGPGARSGSVGQETEMQSRLLKLGIPGVYLPGAMVWHHVPVERCSKEWAIERAYRDAIRDGLSSGGRPSRAVLGYPYRGLVEKGLTVLKEAVWGNEQSRFRSRHEFSSFRGYAKGLRLARRL